jgi:hypothetical protein
MPVVNPRQAIYDAMKFEPQDRKRFEKQLKTELPKLRQWFEIDTAAPDEEARTAILVSYQKSQFERQQKMLKRREAVSQYTEQFQRTFGTPLHRFNHPVLGFDAVAFDTTVVRSGDRSCAEVVKERYGDAAVVMLLALIG